MNEGRVIPAPVLRAYTAALVRALGARDADADRVGGALVDADLCGHRSHGVRQLPYYAGQVQRGEIDPRASPDTILDTPGLTVIDGRHGFGHLIAGRAADLAGERVRRQRVAAVAVRNANHIGRLGEYTERLAAEGLIAILLVSAQGADQQLAPFGGIDRRLTNNPLSIAAPGPDFPLVLDMALSEAAESRVLHAAELATTVPEGWLLDAEGRPSTEPQDYLTGGSLLPVGAAAGSHKGYSLIVMLEVLVGLLTGVALCGPATPPFSNAFVLIALDPANAGTARRPEIAALVDWIKSSRPRPGHAGELLVPGELEARRRRAAGQTVTLDAVTVGLLDGLAGELGVADRLAERAAPSGAGA